MAIMVERNVSSDGKHVMTAEQFKKWLKTSFDANGDGRISKAELRRGIRHSGGLIASWRSGRVFKSADTNNDGFIDEHEFRNLVHFADKYLNLRIIR
ncbi:hypothetical protein HN51_018057 [Arachis hypogaea]|uniref:EF-hand domain-containing protein n=1 Tax=Arachis hypogaea TaxID=3818 RepID=A0A445BS32_ARAHY|nr:Calmodulin [Arachis hypogaea]RYR41500.1 hypothetical protein Ahy_A08g037899 [Arachis hypogaea]